MTGLVLLDRDGTINVERNYLSAPEQVELLPGAAEGIRLLRELGLVVAVVTNQSGVGRGYFDGARLGLIHRRLEELLGEGGAGVDAIYVCPHVPEERCECRKPAPGLARRAGREWGVDLKTAFVIGDKACDVDLGCGVGATTILVRTGYGREFEGKVRADFVADDLVSAGMWIGEMVRGRSEVTRR